MQQRPPVPSHPLDAHIERPDDVTVADVPSQTSIGTARRPWFDSPWIAFYPILFSLLLFVTYMLAQGRLGARGAGAYHVTSLFVLDKPPADPGAARKLLAPDSAARVARAAWIAVESRRFETGAVWSFFVGVTVLLEFIALGLAAVMIHSSPVSPVRKGLAATTAVVLALGVIDVAVSNPYAHMLVMYSALEQTVAGINAHAGRTGAATFMNWFNAIGYGVTVVLVAACSMLIYPEKNGAGATVEKGGTSRDLPVDAPADHERPMSLTLVADLERIQRRQLLLRQFLYWGTALLVVGVLRMSAVFSWVFAFVPPSDSNALQGIRTTSVAIIGATYTLLLAYLYVPAALILRARAVHAMDTGSPSADVEKRFAELVSAQSVTTMLPRILAITAPLLTGPIGELVTRVAQLQ